MRLDGNLLRGWKEIEEELGLTRQRIIAWGFPIHRKTLPNGGLGGVYAFKKELLRYLNSASKEGIAKDSREFSNIDIQEQLLLPL